MRIIVVVAAGLGLAGCSSFSMPDMFKSTPPSATIQLESLPAGAEARASSGETCKTPCSLSVVAAENFSVTFSLPKYQPETVPVQIIRDPSGPGVVVDPNPVYAELQPALPTKKGRAAPKAAPKAKKPPAPAAAEPAEEPNSPFPPPPRR
ncbi:PEGA domain-containing protein [Afipia massiliensis]|uniref:PEGA domain-containing protein n=1 Tax=Afipia massiliensis TaxID=211460 RepID=A0A4V6Y1F8_9BRAD|nr:PEGA domain-containing protein [Afipia massiliensis]TKT73603.1 PEGA domain-containing protein [Afipia massiliensis]